MGDLESLCFNQIAEGLQLEFKEKEDPTTAVLSKTDQKGIAEVVSAFANSDGGTLIFGVKTHRKGSADVAVELVAIADIRQFARNFSTVCSLNVSPQNPRLRVRTIDANQNATTGFLVCDVERSDRRPHMSTAPGVHRYYRRSFEGTVPMTPSEVRDQILAVRDAILEPVVSYPAGGMFSPNAHWISASVAIVFSLKNTGQALCRNPFFRVKGDCELHSHSATFDGDLAAWKTMFPYGTLIHVDDQLSCLTLSLNACILPSVLAANFNKHNHDLTQSVMIFPGSRNHQIQTITDKASLENVELYLRYGAENAPVGDTTLVFRRRDLARGILGMSNVRDMYIQNYGPWATDLVERFRSDDG